MGLPWKGGLQVSVGNSFTAENLFSWAVVGYKHLQPQGMVFEEATEKKVAGYFQDISGSG